MKATATANSNIALIKYWGKRDSKLILPHNSSLSVTLDNLNTQTTVEFNKLYHQDEIEVDGDSSIGISNRIKEHLNIIREMAGIKTFCKVISQNNFPKAAGLASSASGAAALAVAGSKAAGLNLDHRSLSILARQGSGSASRSIDGGFVVWHRGQRDDGLDSFGEQIASEQHWQDFRVLVVVISSEEKPQKSRDGMALTTTSSPFYKSWLESCDIDLNIAWQAVSNKNFSMLGEITEHNCLKMHATMITTQPPIIYWLPNSLAIIHAIHAMRKKNVEAYFTMDAGPNIKIICQEKSLEIIQEEIKNFSFIQDTKICKVGSAAKIINEHLF